MKRAAVFFVVAMLLVASLGYGEESDPVLTRSRRYARWRKEYKFDIPEETGAQKGTIGNPVPMGEPYVFVAQVNADGTRRTEKTDDAYFDVPMAVTLSRYLLPDYYARVHSGEYLLKGNEAGTQLDITLGAVDGLDRLSMQDAIWVVFEDANGETNLGYKFKDAEIGGDTQSTLTTGGSGAIYKRFDYDAAVDLKYMTVTYYYDLQPYTVYFLLSEGSSDTGDDAAAQTDWLMVGADESGTVEGAESPFPSSAPQHIVLVTDWLHNMLCPDPGKWTFDI